MLDLQAWRESWNDLRREFDKRSLAHAHSQVNLCRWHDDEFDVAKSHFRADDVMRLTEFWEYQPIKGKPRSTRISRRTAMGIGSRHMIGDMMYWLMHERVARVAQILPTDWRRLAAEEDTAREVETIFQNL